MLFATRFLLQAQFLCLPVRRMAQYPARAKTILHLSGMTCLALSILATPAAASARDTNPPATPEATSDKTADNGAQNNETADNKAADEWSSPVTFEADSVEYDENSDKVTARGNVVLIQNGKSARADTVVWDQQKSTIFASGGVRLIDEDGNQIFTEDAELTDDFKTGAITDAILAFRTGGRLASQSGERQMDGTTLLKHASYSACAVEDAFGCPKEPTWRINASQVVYNPDTRTVRFTGARLIIFGFLQIPLPGLSLKTDGGATSGLLIPDFRSSPSNGLEITNSYFWKIAPNRDLTTSVSLFTKTSPVFSGQYRTLNDKGAYQITGYATHSRLIPIADHTTVPDSEKRFRGYIFTNGQYQLSENWSITGSIRRTTDRTFLRRYDISDDDRLRSTINAERIDDTSYLSIAGWATQTMRANDAQGQVPIALPAIDYRKVMANSILGGRIELQANSLGIIRPDGQDTQRAFARAQWDLSRITRGGQVITLTTLLRSDVYHSSNNDLTSTITYRGNSGWQARTVATAAVDVKWPLSGSFAGVGTQVFVPRFQIVATPKVRNLAVPNEDSRAIDLEDTNLFSLNRFPGYDRVDDGLRFTYGFDWEFQWPRWRVKTTLGQSYRMSNKPTILPNGTGITDRLSDYVGRVQIRYRDLFTLTHRFRLDKDSLAFRRNEIDATIGSQQTYAEIGYVKLDRNIAMGIEDLRDREELRAAARVKFLKYWSAFGSTSINLTNKKADPVFGSDGFQPLRSRFGLAYSDDCIDVSVTWRRDFTSTGDASRGNTFLIRLSLKKLGV